MKKDEARFSIRFNLTDPRHRKAKEVLEAAGRRKASLIADAVWEYIARYGDNTEKIIPTFATATAASRENISQNIFHLKESENLSDSEMCQTILDGLAAFTS